MSVASMLAFVDFCRSHRVKYDVVVLTRLDLRLKSYRCSSYRATRRTRSTLYSTSLGACGAQWAGRVSTQRGTGRAVSATQST